jgi:hypothetical protein
MLPPDPFGWQLSFYCFSVGMIGLKNLRPSRPSDTSGWRATTCATTRKNEDQNYPNGKIRRIQKKSPGVSGAILIGIKTQLLYVLRKNFCKLEHRNLILSTENNF